MYFNFDKQFNILNVNDETFAKLESIDKDGNLNFEFTYSVNQKDVVQKNALLVNVSVISKVVSKKMLLEDSQKGDIDSQSLIDNILSQIKDAKLRLKQQETYVIASRNSDISAKINNEIIGQLRSNAPSSQIRSLSKTSLTSTSVFDLNQDNEIKPLMQFIAHSSIPVQNINTIISSSYNLNTQLAMYDMLLKQGLDPSYITQLTHRSIPAINTFQGTLRQSKVNEVYYEPSVQLLNHYIFSNGSNPNSMTTEEFSDNTIIQTLETTQDLNIEITINVTIPRFAYYKDSGEINFSNYIVKFDLLDNVSKSTIDSITKELDISKHIHTFYTPQKPPKIIVGTSTFHNNLQISKADDKTTGFYLYKKVISKSLSEINDYVKIGYYPHVKDYFSVPVEKHLNSCVIYRVVPIGKFGTIGFDYTNVVIKPSRYTPVKATVVDTRNIESGIEINVRNFPVNAISIEVLVRNLSINEKDYRVVGVVNNLIDDATRTLGHISVIDNSVTDYNVYEYVSKITYDSGLTDLSGYSSIEYVKLNPGKVDIKITNIIVSNENNEPNVTFNLNSTIIDENIDVILALLKRQDIKEYFNNDILKEREFLKNLIAHSIQRVNITTGIREDFGVIIDSFFSDKDNRVNNSVLPLKYGHKYRYEITTLLRAPETMFNSFIKEKTDEITKKSYKFSPAKFLHPIVLRQGVIVTSAGLRTKYTKDPMTYGNVGAIKTFDISFDNQPARIVNQSAAKFNKNLNVITWKLEGSIEFIDHFLIIKDVHGVRTIIGKAHSEFQFGNCQYLHQVSSKDFGELKYIIVPIFNDYTSGVFAITNSLIV